MRDMYRYRHECLMLDTGCVHIDKMSSVVHFVYSTVMA